MADEVYQLLCAALRRTTPLTRIAFAALQLGVKRAITHTPSVSLSHAAPSTLLRRATHSRRWTQHFAIALDIVNLALSDPWTPQVLG